MDGTDEGTMGDQGVDLPFVESYAKLPEAEPPQRDDNKNLSSKKELDTPKHQFNSFVKLPESEPPQKDDKKDLSAANEVIDGGIEKQISLPLFTPTTVFKDPRVQKNCSSFTEEDFNLKHTKQSAIGDYYVHFQEKDDLEKSKHHHHRHSTHHFKRRARSKSQYLSDDETEPSPGDVVKGILGEDSSNKVSANILSELAEYSLADNEEQLWYQSARWIKFEEDVEESGDRFSKPHVGTLSLHSLFELRSYLLNGALLFDCDGLNLDQVSSIIVDKLISSRYLPLKFHDNVKELLLKRHHHCFYKTMKHEDSIQNFQKSKTLHSKLGSLPIIRNFSHSRLKDIERQVSTTESNNHSLKDAYLLGKGNENFMKKVPSGSETCNILIAETDFLQKPVSVLVRLNDASELSDLTEVPVPTRFIFLLLGTEGDLLKFHEVGRAMGTLMSDEIFREIAYKSTKRQHLIAGIDEFLDAVTVLPPGEWDPSIRIEPPNTLPSQEGRINKSNPSKEDAQNQEELEDEIEDSMRVQSGLVRTGRFCGGLINDLRRKKKHYFSDFEDAVSMQCVASWLFLYFGCLTPIVTFGGLLGEATEQRLASMESLVAGMICGIGWGLFSGQPLTILGSTGPVLVFEKILYDFCKTAEFDYLSFRLWTGIWVGVILIIFVAFDISFLVCYITRFTEENFATLIGIIFMYESLAKLVKIQDKNPIFPPDDRRCYCYLPAPPSNGTINSTVYSKYSNISNWATLELDQCEKPLLLTQACEYVPNVFFVSVVLYILTYLITHQLKNFKETSFFTKSLRKLIADFAVIIAILTVTLLDYLIGVKTPKLNVPSTFAPTWSGRGWLVQPFTNAWWTVFAAIIPALLATILIFMDQQITAVIVNRRENKLRKGCGYHLDLLVVACLIMICSILGLPFFVAATVLSVTHVSSLTLESSTSAPGEKPAFLGILEQRVTQLMIFFTIGMSVFMGPILKLIPLPVLYAIFLFMGASSLKGLQFMDRIMIIFMPPKYQPDLPYLRKVNIKRVHLFTFIQLICLIMLCVIKEIESTKMLFPVMLVVMIGIRKLLDKYFTRHELKVLDDILPEFRRKELDADDDEEDACDDDCDDENRRDCDGNVMENDIVIPMKSGNIMKINVPPQTINLSNEVKKCGVWKNVNSANVDEDDYERRHPRRKHRHRHGKHRKHRSSSGNRMPLISEEERHGIASRMKKQMVNDSHVESDPMFIEMDDVNSAGVKFIVGDREGDEA